MMSGKTVQLDVIGVSQ